MSLKFMVKQTENHINVHSFYKLIEFRHHYILKLTLLLIVKSFVYFAFYFSLRGGNIN